LSKIQDRSVFITGSVQLLKVQNQNIDENMDELEHQNKVLINNTISGQKMALLN